MRKVVFDVDDILWSLNRRVCKQTGIPYEEIITFSIHENPLLTESEKEKMLKQYGNPESFKNIPWFDGIKRIMELKADVYINSNSLNEDCSYYKTKELQQVLNMPNNHIIINIVGQKKTDSIRKIINEDTYIFVDDSPDNVASSHAKYNIMICTPWNQSEKMKELTKEKNVIFCKDLNEVIDVIEKLLKLEE